MKKIFAVMLCALMLASCGTQEEMTPSPSPDATAQATKEPEKNSDRTKIEPSGTSPIDESWTVLGEAGMTIGGEYCDIYLATSAQRASDGYMMWDDSQQWALTVSNETETYVLLDANIHGKAYMIVENRSNTPVISLIRSTSTGLAVTEYTYEDGAFYGEEILNPPSDGNNIYSSIPDYWAE